MVKIRLERIGKRNRPFYRVVVMDSRSPRNGKVLDIIGWFDPLKEGEGKIKFDKLEKWLNQGAQMTPRVKKLVKYYSKKEENTTPAPG